MPTPVDPWVQLKFRVRESLRAKLEEAAQKNGTSLNYEIVTRLWRSFEWQDAAKHPFELISNLGIVSAHANEIARVALEVSGALMAAGQAGGARLREEGQDQ